MSLQESTAKFAQVRSRLHDTIGKVIIGYKEVMDDLLVGLLAGGHVLIEGVPGVSKTTLAKTFANSLDMRFQRIQFTQDLLPADITGHYFFDTEAQEFKMRKGPVFTNVLLADELNRAPPKTQSALLEAMEESQVTIEGTTFPLANPFLVLATMNPIDVEGVYGLPEAQLDRFMLRTKMTYLPHDDEKRMMMGKLNGLATAAITERLKADVVMHGKQLTSKVHVEKAIIDYMHAIAVATREHDGVTLGASPRAMEQLLKASRAKAVLRGRHYATPDDVKSVAHQVLDHRIILDVDAEVEGTTTFDIVHEILQTVPVPTGLK